MIFKYMQEELGERALKQSKGGSFDDRIKRTLNIASGYVANVENEGRWMQKFMSRYTLTTTADQNWLVLPLDFDSINKLWHEEYSTEEIIRILPEENYRHIGKNVDTQTNPEYAMIKAGTNVLAQPSSASVLTASSSSSADTKQNITYFGIVGGYPYVETINLNGTNDVSTNASYTRVDKQTKDASTTGTITTTSNLATVTVSVMPANLLSHSIDYKLLYFHPYPDSATSLYADYIRKQYWMENDYDTPLLGDEFDNAILLYAEWILNNEDKRMVQYIDVIKKLKVKYNYTPGANYEVESEEMAYQGAPFNYDDGNYPRQKY